MQHGWTLDKQKWEHLLTVVRGTHWSKTILDKLYRDDVPKNTGVYAICAKIPNFDQRLFEALYNIVYVGKADTGTLQRRFLDHCNQPKQEIDKAKKCFGYTLEYWFTEVKPNLVPEIETCLIKCFGPPANLISGQKIPARFGSPQRA